MLHPVAGAPPVGDGAPPQRPPRVPTRSRRARGGRDATMDDEYRAQQRGRERAHPRRAARQQKAARRPQRVVGFPQRAAARAEEEVRRGGDATGGGGGVNHRRVVGVCCQSVNAFVTFERIFARLFVGRPRLLLAVVLAKQPARNYGGRQLDAPDGQVGAWRQARRQDVEMAAPPLLGELQGVPCALEEEARVTAERAQICRGRRRRRRGCTCASRASATRRRRCAPRTKLAREARRRHRVLRCRLRRARAREHGEAARARAACRPAERPDEGVEAAVGRRLADHEGDPRARGAAAEGGRQVRGRAGGAAHVRADRQAAEGGADRLRQPARGARGDDGRQGVRLRGAPPDVPRRQPGCARPRARAPALPSPA